MGDPIELRVRGYELTLRAQDAAMIEIVPAEEAEKPITCAQCRACARGRGGD